jgi:phosphatidate cytidylyltransferase
VTEGEAAPAALASRDSRNLLMRVIAALVLAPLAIAIAYAGGWLWAGAGDAGGDRPLRRMADDRRAGAQSRAWSRRAAALAIAGFCLASGGSMRRCLHLARLVAERRVALAGAAHWAAAGFLLCRRGRNRIGAGALDPSGDLSR